MVTIMMEKYHLLEEVNKAMIIRNTNKKFNSKSAAISYKTFLTALITVVIVTTPISANLSSIDISYAEQEQQSQISK